ncbi:hypothetical protein JVU11DRAFT_10049 [Chiua virens]|nr:hypothetical protein JVU11DRAFT_10049 [Chiua virens]
MSTVRGLAKRISNSRLSVLRHAANRQFLQPMAPSPLSSSNGSDTSGATNSEMDALTSPKDECDNKKVLSRKRIRREGRKVSDTSLINSATTIKAIGHSSLVRENSSPIPETCSVRVVHVMAARELVRLWVVDWPAEQRR